MPRRGDSIRGLLAVLVVPGAMAFGEPVPRPPEGIRAAARLAKEASDPEAIVRGKLKDLDADVLAVRERASNDLASDDRVTLEGLERVLHGGGLTPEQRTRLEEVGYALFSRSPRAALGVTFADGVTAQTVTLKGPVETFDAARVLKQDDTLYALGGVVCRSRDDAVKAIMSFLPDEWAPIHLFRDGEPIVVHARMGYYRDLPDLPGRQRGGTIASIPSGMARSAWQIRLARKASPEGEGGRAIDLRLTAEQVQDLEARSAPKPDARAAGRPGGQMMMAVRPTPDPQPKPIEEASLVAGGTSLVVNEPTRTPFRAFKGGIGDVEALQLKVKLEAIDQEMVQLMQRIAQQPNQPARDKLLERITDLQRERDMIKQRMLEVRLPAK